MSFTSQVLKQEIEHRLQTQNLFPLEECRGILAQLLKKVADDAKRDFDEMLALDKKLPKLRPGEEPIHAGLSSSTTALASIYDIQTASASAPDDPREKLQHLKTEIHLSIIKILDVAQAQRKERQQLIRQMIAMLPEAGEAKARGSSEMM
eukprot:Amastigsp_a842391_175.p1 type:complete len:150 gc:universal Amastigsp_a842391_175:483-34(-)